MTRLDATKRLLATLTTEPVIASLGHPAYDLYAAGDRPRNFYTWGSMGLASSIGLGLALARPEQRVIVLDGDGSLLMNLGSLATIGACAPRNLVVVVWDNEEYGTTGGQPTWTANRCDLAGIARAAGVAEVGVAKDEAELDRALDASRTIPGPWVLVVKVAESRPTQKPPLDPVYIKQRFMAAIGCAEPATQGGAT
jgi:thiamine pyrophosphate-dependent acetolactate synthase large subunit-like protein